MLRGARYRCLLTEPEKYRWGCSQPIIGLSTRIPMKELDEGLQELKGLQLHRKNSINQPEHMERTMGTAAYAPEDYLIWHQWEGSPLVLWRVDDPVVENARALK